MTALNEVFRALSDPTRREIVQLLRSGSRTAGELAAAFPLAKSTLSAHFAVLKQAGLIVGERRGASIVYRLNPSVLHDLVGVVLGWLGERAPQPAPRAPRAAPPVVPQVPPAPQVPPGPRPQAPLPLLQAKAPRARTGATTRMDVLRGGLLFLTGGLAGGVAGRPTSGGDAQEQAAGPELGELPGAGAPAASIASAAPGPTLLTRRFDIAAAARKFAH